MQVLNAECLVHPLPRIIIFVAVVTVVVVVVVVVAVETGGCTTARGVGIFINENISDFLKRVIYLQVRIRKSQAGNGTKSRANWVRRELNVN